jgi:uncharacterized protein (TIRG00374 family)
MTEQAGTKHRSNTRRIVQSVISLALVVGILWFVFKGIDFADVWAHIIDMTWIEIGTLLLAAFWNLATYALVWMSVTPRLGFWRAFVLAEASTAVGNTLPAGAAIGIGVTYAMLGSWGFSGSRRTVAILVSGVWNSFIKLGMPVLALALLALQGGASPARITAALVGVAGLAGAIAIFAAMLHSERNAERLGLLAGRIVSRALALIRRPPVHGWEIATTKFRARTIGLVAHRWIAITAASLVSHLSLYFVLLLALRHVGVGENVVSWVEVLAVFAFARLATAVPFTPGGLGVVEAVLIGGLVAAGGVKEQVAAAVLVYRALTWFLPIPVGVASYLYWRATSMKAGEEREREAAEDASGVPVEGSP